MITIDIEKCIGCGQCVKDCFGKNLAMEDNKAKVLKERCMQCGHCVAVCPENAVEITDYDMAEVIDIAPPKFSAEDLIDFIKCRRSIRQYKDRPVEPELLDQIIEAGRFTPTGGNRQEITFVVVEKEMEQFRKIVIENLAILSDRILNDENAQPGIKGYAKRWIGIAERYKNNPDDIDDVFFRAPMAILITGDHNIDAGLAASNMELVACANKLGVLYSGFITRGANFEEAKKIIGVPEGKEVLTAMLVGYPNVKYMRSAPRREASVVRF